MNILRGIVLISAFRFFSISVFPQGALTPPGPPVPTMKSLDQVRSSGIPINATNTPGNSSNQFIINSPGSYYLTGNIIGVSGKNGILITNVDISIDLNGFAMIGVSGSLAGITDGGVSGRGEFRIHNGMIRTWGGAGIDINASANSIIANVIVAFNGGNGMNVGNGCVLRDCLARQNSETGISTAPYANVFHCTASGNVSGTGIGLGANSTASDCAANNNGQYGIFAEQDCKIFHAVANLNSSAGISGGVMNAVIGCATQKNNGYGIDLSDHALVSDCSVTGNTQGIHITNFSFVHDCTVTHGPSPIGPGIQVDGSVNRIEANNVTGNTSGILVTGSGNLIIKNSAHGNTINYNIAANNVFGVIVDRTSPGSAAVSGNSAASSANTTDPWANFSY